MSHAVPRPLEPTELRQIEQRFQEAIKGGLQEDNREIRALPAFITPPRTKLVGQALVLDTGGTNMRAALVSFGPRGEIEVTGPVGRTLRETECNTLGRAAFFEHHAALALSLGAPPGLPVGYCFSYPFEAQPDGDARLIRWTKGIQVSGVVGELVGTALAEALAKHQLAPKSVCVLNDTVAALLGGAASSSAPSTRHIGLIVGTGTNMASFFTPTEAPKLVRLGAGPMAINLESGNFSPPGLSELDEALAVSAEPRNLQRFEKAVSGLYLSELYALARPEDRDWAHAEGTPGLVSRAELGTDPGSQLARDLLQRSAQLVASGLAAVARIHVGTAPMNVLAEGGLFWGWSGYRSAVERSLQQVCPEIPFEISRMEHANLVGAAFAALSAQTR